MLFCTATRALSSVCPGVARLADPKGERTKPPHSYCSLRQISAKSSVISLLDETGSGSKPKVCENSPINGERALTEAVETSRRPLSRSQRQSISVGMNGALLVSVAVIASFNSFFTLPLTFSPVAAFSRRASAS